MVNGRSGTTTRTFESAHRFARAAQNLVECAAGVGPTAPTVGADLQALCLVTAVLWERFLRLDPEAPDWSDSDRFLVSSARLLPLLNAFLTLTGPQHSDRTGTGGAHHALHVAAGLAGQAVAAAAGMAMGEKILAGRFGNSLVDHRTWLVATPVDLDTGVALEVSALAARFRLERLTVIVADVPDAHGGRDADLGLSLDRIEAAGWAVRRAAADDADALGAALMALQRARRPGVLVCEATRQELGDPCPTSTAESGDYELTGHWSATARRGRTARHAWLRRFARHRQRAEFERTSEGRPMPCLIEDWRRAWAISGSQDNVREGTLAACWPGAGWQIVGKGLHGRDILAALLPEFVVLSSYEAAEKGPDAALEDWTTDLRLSCGNREPAMVGLMNGLALHGGVIACGTASLAAVDRMRPALRFAALTRQRVLCVFVEDDPGGGGMWQQIEQLASLRAIPNLALFRPGDDREVAAAWECALAWNAGPAVIVLGRCPTVSAPASPLRQSGGFPNQASHKGGYILEEAPDGAAARQVTIIAAGPEVAVARKARSLLCDEGIRAALVSLPCWELFARQDTAYRSAVLGGAPRVAVEAASGFGWERWLGADGVFIGRNEFGSASTFDLLYDSLGITPEGICDRVREVLDTGPKTESRWQRSVLTGEHDRRRPRITVKREAP